MINDLSIVDMSIGEVSKTFWDIRELISFSRAEVHFSGVGDFDIAIIDFGIYTDRGEDNSWRLREFNIGKGKLRLVPELLKEDSMLWFVDDSAVVC